MKLQDNPFYILRLSCDANRRDIASATEEMSFIHDAELCTDAQSQLINQAKRLTAEVCWFLDLDANELDIIRDNIDNETSISTEALTSLSKLNATLFNFCLSDEEDPFEIGYSILDLDEQYSALDVKGITTLVNRNRTAAKLALVQEQAVTEEINKRRDEIRQAVTDRLSPMNQEAYVELVTMLAEKCIADGDYNDGVVLSDIIDQYEIRMQSTLEKSAADIKEHIERIKQLTNSSVFRSEELRDATVSDSISELIEQVKKWDVLAQPLQIKSQASGMPHRNSESLGRDLRNLALFLHNEKGNTQKALDLVNAMQDVFAELGSISDLFDTDAEALSDLLQGEEEAKEVLAEMDALHELSNSIKAVSTSTNVNAFIDRVRKLDVKLKQLDLDAETKTKVRENLCYLARGTAIELHNTKHQTLFALNIAKALAAEFSDMPSLQAKLNEDSLALNQQLLLANSANTNHSQNSSSKSNTGCLVFVGIAIIVAIIIALSSGGGTNSSEPSTNSTYKPKASATAKPSSTNSSGTTQAQKETKFSSSATSGDKVYADIVSIFPEIGIYTEGSSNYSYFVCRCVTSTGGEVWIYLTVNEYKSNFDSTASTSIFAQYAEEVTLSSSKRIHGTVTRADGIMSGLSADTGTLVINFASVK